MLFILKGGVLESHFSSLRWSFIVLDPLTPTPLTHYACTDPPKGSQEWELLLRDLRFLGHTLPASQTQSDSPSDHLKYNRKREAICGWIDLQLFKICSYSRAHQNLYNYSTPKSSLSQRLWVIWLTLPLPLLWFYHGPLFLSVIWGPAQVLYSQAGFAHLSFWSFNRWEK